MKESLKQDLGSLICEGNVAKLPTTQLNNYAELKKTLTKACGKYKRNTFEFPYPAKSIVESLMSGKSIDFKKEFQFFPTPTELVERVCQDIIFDKDEINILEPSAGHGAFIKHVLTLNEDIKKNVFMIELSELNFSILKDLDLPKANQLYIEKADFLETKDHILYDLILANPPFTKNQDIDHIKKMYSLLSDGGQLLTLSSTSWVRGSQKKQVEFREWLDDAGATCTAIDQGAFKSSGTNVATMYINICK